MNNYKSGLEKTIARQLKKLKIKFDYEKLVILYTKPAQLSRYTPDFILPNGIIIESKGRFVVADRQKHLFIRKQYGRKHDIRFVFYNSKSKINKRSKTTYANWCEKNGFKFFDKIIPAKWIKEKYAAHRS